MSEFKLITTEAVHEIMTLSTLTDIHSQIRYMRLMTEYGLDNANSRSIIASLEELNMIKKDMNSDFRTG